MPRSSTSAPPSAAPSITASAIEGAESAHVAADRDRARLELLDVGAADGVGALLVELAAVEAADVVRLEDLGSSIATIVGERGRVRPVSGR